MMNEMTAVNRTENGNNSTANSKNSTANNTANRTADSKNNTGLVCGRFQIFHKDHLKYVLAAAKRCEHLLVGITSPDPSMAPAEKADTNRGKETSNPCTYYERMQMVKSALKGAGVPAEKFDIIPFPIGRPELIPYYVPKEVTCFITIYDAWGDAKKERLQTLGYQVEVLWQVQPQEKGISSSTIRKRIADGKDWKAFVPEEVYQYIQQNGIDKRIRRLLETAR